MIRRRNLASLYVLCAAVDATGTLRRNNHNTNNDNKGHDRNLEVTTYCGCVECTQEVFWKTLADGHTCGERIEWLKNGFTELYRTEEDACAYVAGNEFPDICRDCDPARCTPVPPVSPAHCGCEACTNEIWESTVNGYTCGSIFEFVRATLFQYYPSEKDACKLIAGLSPCRNCDPDICPLNQGKHLENLEMTSSPTFQVPELAESPHCGCAACTDEVWNTDADGHSCGERIEYLFTNYPNFYPTEEHACAEVAGVEFSTVCGSACDPARCEAITQNNGPLLGSNVIIFDPNMAVDHIQETFDDVYEAQKNNEMGTSRYSLYFLPGVYGSQDQPLQVRIGYYTEVAGLGSHPNDVIINGKIEVYNRCFEPGPYNSGKFIPAGGDNAVCFALNNFWRSLSNLSININSRGQDQCRATANFWAISQASSMRRVDIRGGDISLMDYCNNPAYASGGYMSDSRAGKVINGSQQQFLSRNLNVAEWSGSVWNQVFVGVVGAPDDSDFPVPPFTSIWRTPISREKPFLFVDYSGQHNVRVPTAHTETNGITWDEGLTPGRTIPISYFYIADPTDSVENLNRELSLGKHLIFTPGVYDIGSSIYVQLADTVILGLGHATLTAVNGATPLKIADRPGIIVAGLTIDAGTVESPVLLQVGDPNAGGVSTETDPSNPITLHDIYFRIGGPHIGKTDIAMEVNSDHVLIDHTWVWRADHGVENFDENDGFDGDNQRWETVIGRTGVVVNGDDVTVHGLFVEHFQQHNVVWNGERGQVYLFQNELPYEPPTQQAWMNQGRKGWAAYKVTNSVTSHELWGGGVYCYNRNNPDVETDNAFEVPVTPGVKLTHIMTRNLSGPGTINSVVNGIGGVVNGHDRGPVYLKEYP